MSDTSLAMLPWFPRDFIASTRAMRLAERGAYRELLDYQWEMGKLPREHDRLARLLGITLAEFDDLWPAISEKFVDDGGFLRNKRLEEHRSRSLEQRDKKRKAAEQTNAKRNAQRNGGRTQNAAHSDTVSASLSGTPPSPSPSMEIRDYTETRAREAAQRDPKTLADDAEAHIGFERIRKAYPPRSGRQNWIVAEHNARLLIDRGYTWNALLEAVKRYAKYVDSGGVSSTAHVLGPENFFSAPDKPWENPWDLPVAKRRVIPKHEPFVAPDDEPEAARA